MNKSDIKIVIEHSPYGDTGVTYEGMLGMVQHWILQLKHFRDPRKTKEQSEYLEADIRGYEEVLKSKSEKNARMFILIKQDRKLDKKKFTNEDVVSFMKEKNIWEQL